jgi:hypothetical protein
VRIRNPTFSQVPSQAANRGSTTLSFGEDCVSLLAKSPDEVTPDPFPISLHELDVWWAFGFKKKAENVDVAFAVVLVVILAVGVPQ